MPTNGTARGLSALAGFGLFLTAIVLCYLNTTTSGLFGSTLFLIAIAVTGLGMAAKWAIALGVENGFAVGADKVASLLPWIAVAVNIFQGLHYKEDGMSGFMAGIAVLALVFVGAFGLLDSVASLLGKKFHELQEAASEASKRLAAVNEAAHGRR